MQFMLQLSKQRIWHCVDSVPESSWCWYCGNTVVPPAHTLLEMCHIWNTLQNMSFYEHMLAKCVVRICSMRHVQYVRFPSLQLVCWSSTSLFWTIQPTVLTSSCQTIFLFGSLKQHLEKWKRVFSNGS